GLSNVAEELGVTVGLKHKKINVSNSRFIKSHLLYAKGYYMLVAWEHEQFSRLRVTAATLSGHSAPPDLLESTGGLFDNSPRVPNKEFTVHPSNDSLINFLMELGYKGQMKQLSDMFVDHMHQPWRTLRTIINRCLSGKTSSNDRLRPSRVEILWGMYNKEKFDNVALIREDLQYQIDNRQGLLYNTSEDDGVLGRLKFISKEVHLRMMGYLE
ncbi:hypothetical protein Tco_0715351, partial [Tanacetum coccineum]